MNVQYGQNTALQMLSQVTSVEVQEKANLIEAVTALLGAEIEMANRYRILDQQGAEIMYAVEQTDCLTRQFKSCCGDCAPWNVDIMYTYGGASQKVFSLTRPCTMTCCCFNRPVMTVVDATNGSVLGSMVDPFACCDLTFTMQDPQGGDVLKGKGGCCQWGLCCPLPCGPCSEVNFPIHDASSDQEVGHIQKKVPSCLKFLFASDVDNYKIEFGAVENPSYKAMLIAMTIFIDFRYFNDNKNDNNNGGPGQQEMS